MTHGAVDPVSKQPELKAVGGRASSRVGRDRGASCARRSARGASSSSAPAWPALEAVEEVLRRDPDAGAITMLGEEPGAPYNRILLSKLLARRVRAGRARAAARRLVRRSAASTCAAAARRRGSTSTARRGDRRAPATSHPYDALVLATGSRPFVPPIPGADRPQRARLPHARRRRRRSPPRRAPPAAPSSSAAGCSASRPRPASAPAARRSRSSRPPTALMAAQLDARRRRCSRARSRRAASRSRGRRRASDRRGRVRLVDGEALEADLVVVAAGIRPETALARDAGLEVERGIVVDDALRASAPGVWAVGECAEHRGTVYGLWAPLAEQARVAGASVARRSRRVPPARSTATKLKVAGVDLFAGGAPRRPTATSWSGATRGAASTGGCCSTATGSPGAILVGDTADARELSALLRTGDAVPERAARPRRAPPRRAAAAEPEDVICACNASRRGEIDAAIAAGGLTHARRGQPRHARRHRLRRRAAPTSRACWPTTSVHRSETERDGRETAVGRRSRHERRRHRHRRRRHRRASRSARPCASATRSVPITLVCGEPRLPVRPRPAVGAARVRRTPATRCSCARRSGSTTTGSTAALGRRVTPIRPERALRRARRRSACRTGRSCSRPARRR